MSRLIPKILYNPKTHIDVPVWELNLVNKPKVFYERKHIKGFLPVGVLGSFNLNKTLVLVLDTVYLKPGEHINKFSDDFEIPMNWYSKNIITNEVKLAKTKTRKIKPHKF